VAAMNAKANPVKIPTPHRAGGTTLDSFEYGDGGGGGN
jgi:hypothetical protein